MTERPRAILVAVDFGEASARAVAIAGALAARCGATLRLLHAESFEAPPYFSPEQIETLEAEQHTIRSRVKHALIDFGRRHTSHPFTAVVDDRSPTEGILTASEGSDLLVMGTHGRHGPTRWWLGSVAERVLRELGQPLLIVRGEAVPTAPERVFQRVLVHASPPVTGAATLAYARALAVCFDGEAVTAGDGSMKPPLPRSAFTLLAVATPFPRSGGWLSDIGEPLVRACEHPILFVPEVNQGGHQ
jgi:nucleotide-binding universal stress UspA family protein